MLNNREMKMTIYKPPTRSYQNGGDIKNSNDLGLKVSKPKNAELATLLKADKYKEQFLNTWNTDPKIKKFRESFISNFGYDPDPFDKESKYDYVGAVLSGDRPSIHEADGLYHWSSKYKANDHPNRFVNGVDTKGLTPSYKFGGAISNSGFLNNTNAVAGVGGLATAIGQSGSPNGFKGFLSGAGSGAAAGAAIGGPWGAVIGGAIGGITGLIGGRKKKKELEAQENEQELARRRMIENEANADYIHSQGVLNQYPTEGISNVNYYGKVYKYGGGISKMADYYAEDAEVIEYDENNPPTTHANGEVQPLSSSMGVINGDSHSDSSGGVAMSGGERIYSDKINPSEMGKAYLKMTGLNNKGSYADVAKRLGKLERKQEISINSDDRFEKQRASRMTDKIAEAKEIIFADQEATKPVEKMETFKYGGKIPKYQFGVEVPKPSTALRLPLSTSQQFFKNMNAVMPSTPSTDQQGFLGKAATTIGNNLDLIAPVAQYFTNERSINQIPLTQETRMYKPVYADYTRRDANQQARIGQSVRQAARYGTAGSTQTRNSFIGDLVSRGMNASNDVSDAENRRIDNLKTINIQSSNQAGLYNTDLTNRTYGDYQQNRMLQLSEKMNNRNNLTQSILGSLQVRKLNERDRQMMELIAERDKERGIISRSDTYTNLLKRYGIS